jgi:hypothetical protein
MASIAETWGTNADERALIFPCDEIIAEPDAVLFRGITIQATSETVFRWLCQMRVAPYSYDWIDNGRKPSPQRLTPDLQNLAVGQEVMRIFNLVSFEAPKHLTLRLKPRSRASKTFGDIAVSYAVVPDPADNRNCRLLVKLIASYPRGVYGKFMRRLLPWGDLIMMRRQLLNFKRLAEADKRE